MGITSYEFDYEDTNLIEMLSLSAEENRILNDGEFWSLNLSNSDNFIRFLTVFEEHALNDPERFTLMKMILESLDYAMDENHYEQSDLIKVIRILKENLQLYKNIVIVESRPESGNNPEFYFNISPYMRYLLKILVIQNLLTEMEQMNWSDSWDYIPDNIADDISSWDFDF